MSCKGPARIAVLSPNCFLYINWRKALKFSNVFLLLERIFNKNEIIRADSIKDVVRI
jgi:hypothetical protein